MQALPQVTALVFVMDTPTAVAPGRRGASRLRWAARRQAQVINNAATAPR
jgi:hypothetical protein